MGDQVEHQRADAQDGIRPAATQLDAHTGHELVERERLGDVVRRSQLEAAELDVELRAPGQDEHGQVGTGVAQALEHRQPAEAGQHEVEDDQIVGAGQRRVEPRGTVAGGVHGQPLGLERVPDEGDEVRLVLDHENPHGDQPAPRGSCAIPRRDVDAAMVFPRMTISSCRTSVRRVSCGVRTVPCPGRERGRSAIEPQPQGRCPGVDRAATGVMDASQGRLRHLRGRRKPAGSRLVAPSRPASAPASCRAS